MHSTSRQIALSVAFAAGLVSTASADAPAMGGAHVGVFVGQGWMDAVGDAQYPFAIVYNGKGAVASIRAGYDFQEGQWVFGVGAEYAESGNRASWRSPIQVYKTIQDHEASLTGRVGYVTEFGVMPYVLAGYSQTRVDHLYTQFGLPFYPESFDRTGWVAGAGAEMPVTGKFSAVIEYRHADYGRDNYTAIQGAYEVSTDQLTIGVNYRF